MLRALCEIWDGAYCRGIIGFELWTVFCEECSEVCLEPTGGSAVGLFADALLGSALRMSQAAGGCKISSMQ